MFWASSPTRRPRGTVHDTAKWRSSHRAADGLVEGWRAATLRFEMNVIGMLLGALVAAPPATPIVGGPQAPEDAFESARVREGEESPVAYDVGRRKGCPRRPPRQWAPNAGTPSSTTRSVRLWSNAYSSFSDCEPIRRAHAARVGRVERRRRRPRDPALGRNAVVEHENGGLPHARARIPVSLRVRQPRWRSCLNLQFTTDGSTMSTRSPSRPARATIASLFALALISNKVSNSDP